MFFKVKLKKPSLRFDSYFFMGTRITNLIEDVFKLHFWCYCFLGRDTAPCQPHFKATQNATKKIIYSLDKYKDLNVLDATGPGLLTKMINNYDIDLN